MKSLGIVRRIDSFGRVVLPMELRRLMDLDQDSAVELYVDGENIILHKYNPACIFCGSFDSLKTFEGKAICESCSKRIGKLSEPEA